MSCIRDERSFPVQKDTDDRLNTEKPFQKKSRATHLRFLLPRLGLLLLAGAVTVMMAAQSAYGTTEAKAQKASGKATVTLADKQPLQATLNSLTISGAPLNAHLIIHIHAKNTDPQTPGLCKGPILFIIKATPGQEAKLQVDGNGKFSAKNLQFTVNNELKPDQQALLNAKDFGTWVVNVHNADIINPVDNKPVSIVCGPIKVGANATKGAAKLKPDPKPKVIPTP